jgi:hypothetical protein
MFLVQARDSKIHARRQEALRDINSRHHFRYASERPRKCQRAGAKIVEIVLDLGTRSCSIGPRYGRFLPRQDHTFLTENSVLRDRIDGLEQRFRPPAEPDGLAACPHPYPCADPEAITVARS